MVTRDIIKVPFSCSLLTAKIDSFNKLPPRHVSVVYSLALLGHVLLPTFLCLPLKSLHQDYTISCHVFNISSEKTGMTGSVYLNCKTGKAIK
jgi:hypothetical protein